MRNETQRHPVAIIGAGASGLMAAVAASRTRPQGVLLLEKEARVGRKLLATGNGRGNLLNLRADDGTHYFGGGVKAVWGLLRKYPPKALMETFAALGLVCRAEADGRVYPWSNQAGAALDVLRDACARQGVRICCDTAVRSVTPNASGFLLETANGGAMRAERVIIAGGGKASPGLGSDGSGFALLSSLGHPITPLYPALAPLKTLPERVRGLKGVRVFTVLTLYAQGAPVRAEEGEALFTEDGISGIAAMQLAGAVHEAMARGQSVSLGLCLLPPADAAAQMRFRVRRWAGEPAEALWIGLMHKRVGLLLLREAGIAPTAPIQTWMAEPLARLLADWRMPVTGTKPFAQAQVTKGGARLDAFDPQTLASRKIPGLYACGEVLDVDGDCGGYNLTWAWASGIAAGTAAARFADAEEGP